MKRSILAAALLFAAITPGMAQAPAPAAQPTIAAKAAAATGVLANKVLGTTPAPAAKAALVNINVATAAELDALPQIGAARTQAIISNRPYKAAKDLLVRKVIPAGAYDAIKDKISVK